MKINAYASSCTFQERADALSWFLHGIGKVEGDQSEVKIVKGFTFEAADLSIMYGTFKPFQVEGKMSRSRCNIVAGSAFTRTPLLILDMPLFGREFGYVNIQQSSYRIQEGHTLNYGTYPTGTTNRWSSIAKKYNVKLKGQSKGNIIGISSQRRMDEGMFGFSIFDWIEDTIKAIRTESNDTIGIKPHGLEIGPVAKANEALYNKILAKYDNVIMIDDIKDCKSLITYTSNISLDALLDGIPVIACHPANFLWNYCSANVMDAINPSLDNRLDALKKLAYIQWTDKEMASGVAWKYLKRMLFDNA